MPDHGYLEQLEAALHARKSVLDAEVMPQVRADFRTMNSSFKGVYQMLLSKALVKEDPYKLDSQPSEIRLPDSDAFSDAQRNEQLSIRLSGYDSVMEYVTAYYQFTCDHVDLREIKILTSLVKYISWQELSLTSGNHTTRAVAELIEKIRGGSDQVSRDLLNSNVRRLGEASRSIMAGLKRVYEFQREQFKFMVRSTEVAQLGDRWDAISSRPEEAVRQIRRLFQQNRGRVAFVPELIEEIVAEDSAEDAEGRRAAVLASLQPAAESATKVEQQKEDLGQILRDGVRILAGSAGALEAAAQKLIVNDELASQRKKNLMDRFREWVDRVTNRGAAPRTYDIEYMDVATGAAQADRVEINAFLAELKRRAKVYNGIISRFGATWDKIAKAEQNQLMDYLSQQSGDVARIARRIEGLDAWFRTEISGSGKAQVKGMKTELEKLRSVLRETNRKRHEYIARSEEEEQLRRLGINQGT